MRKVFQVCAIVVAQMLLLSPSHAQTRDISVHGELLDRIAAVVNDGLVLKSELDDQMVSVEKRLQEQKVDLPSQSVLQQQVLDRLVLQEIQMQRAKHVGLTITDEQLNGALQEIAARNKIPFDQLPTALSAQGRTPRRTMNSMSRTSCCRCRPPPRRSSSRISRTKRRMWPRGPARAKISANLPLRTPTAKRPWTAVNSDGAKARSFRSSFWTSSSK